jgi:hypothetical protein
MPLLAILANPRRARAARKNRCCPNPSRCRHNRAKHHRNTILPMMAGGLMAGVSGAIATRLLRNSSPVLSGIAKDGVLYKVARKASTGEWCVTAYVPVPGGGWKRHEGKTYYGDSKEDAVGTFNYIMGPKGPTVMNNRGGRWYVGLGKGYQREVFFSRRKPTEGTHRSKFLAVVGPYKSSAEASRKLALMNPLSRHESAVILQDSRAWLRAGRRIKATTTHPDWGEADYQRGRVDGLTQTVLRYGPRKARMLATKISKKAGFLANPGVEGFFVWSHSGGQGGQSVAWYPKREEADRVAKQLNYRGGSHYTVVAAGPIATLSKGVRRNPGSVRAYRVPSGYEAKVASTLRNLFVWAQAQDGRVLTIGKPSIVAKVIRHVCGKKVGTALKNSGAEQNVINVPFRPGKKYSVAQVEKWVMAHGTPAMKKRFAMSMAQYKRFHKGSLPKFITYSQYKMGSHPGISDVEFGVSEGHEWMAAYQVPRSSGKWVDQASGGRYVHAHGDSDIDVDVKKPVKLSKLPMRFHTPDGKAVGVIPSKNVKIGEWYEG